MTLSLFSRMLCKASGPQDFAPTTFVLTAILDPESDGEPDLAAYRARHPTPPHSLSSIMRGVDSRSPARFLHMISQKLPVLGAYELGDACRLLCSMYTVAQWGVEVDMAFIRAIGRCQSVFTYLFTVLQDPKGLPEGHGPLGGPAAPNLFQRIIHLINTLLTEAVLKKWPMEQLEASLKLLRHTRFFDALDYTIHKHQTWKECMCMCSALLLRLYACRMLTLLWLMPKAQVHGLIQALRVTVQQQPSTLTLLRPQLPRPRILHTFLNTVYHSRLANTGLEQAVRRTQIEQLIQTWSHYCALERMCLVEGQCMRRGCKKRRRGQCKDCRTTQYCSGLCQKQCVHSGSIPEHSLMDLLH